MLKLVVLVLALIVCLIYFSSSSVSRQAKDTYLAKCAERGDPESCEQAVAEQHQRCFSANYVSGKLESVFHAIEYAQCVDLGYEEWAVKKWKDQQQRLEQKREILSSVE